MTAIYYLGTNKRSDQAVKTLHALDQFCATVGIIHYLIDPGKPAQNGTIERSHREDQQNFYERNKFRPLGDLNRKSVSRMNTITTLNIVVFMGRLRTRYCI